MVTAIVIGTQIFWEKNSIRKKLTGDIIPNKMVIAVIAQRNAAKMKTAVASNVVVGIAVGGNVKSA